MRTLKSVLLAAAAAPVFAAAAQAAPATWSATPVNNNFNNAANWSAGGPPGSGEQGTFGASNTTVVQFGNANTTTGGFTFNSGSPAYTVLVTSGRTVTVNGAGNTRLVSPLITEQTITFSVDALGDLRFIGSNASNGPGSIVYANAGNLLINGGTAGNATIQNGVTGTLSFANSNGGTANIVNSNLFQLNADSDLQNATVVNNGLLRFEGNASAGSSNIVTNDFVEFADNSTAGSSTITINSGGSAVLFYNNSSGGTSRQILNGGVLNISFLSGPGTTFGSVEGASGNFFLLNKNAIVGGNNHSFVAPNAAGERVVEFSGVIEGGTGGITKVGTGTWVLGGANTYTGATNFNGGIVQVNADSNLGNGGPLNFNGGTLRFTGPGGAPVITRVVTLNPGGGTIDVVEGRAVEFATNIGEAGGAQQLHKTGLGNLTMSGNSTYTGPTVIEGGSFTLGTDGAGGNVNGPVQVNNANAVFEIRRSDAFNFGQNISGVGMVSKIGSGETTLSGNNSYSGKTLISNNKLIAAGSNAIGNNSVVELSGNGSFEIANSEVIGGLSGSSTTDPAVRINDRRLTLNGDLGQNAQSFTGNIVGIGGSIRKQGSYTQSITGNLFHSGGTTVDAGAFLVNGQSNGEHIINQGGTFGSTNGGNAVVNGNVSVDRGTIVGNTRINGNLTVDSGTISPGNSPGKVFVTGNYIPSATFGSPNYDVDILSDRQNAPVNPVLPAAGSPTHDLLEIGGNITTATNTRLRLRPTGEPVATTGDGLEIVRVAGNSNADDFFLATDAQTEENGFHRGFQYLVDYKSNTPAIGDQFFLRTVVREELVAHAAMLAAGRQMGRDCFRGPQTTQPGDGKGEMSAWATGRYGSFEADASTGADFDSDYFCMNGGVDFNVGQGFSLGLRGGYATQDVDLRVVQGVANLDGDTWNFEAAIAYANQEGYYSGLTLGYRSTDWDYRKALLSGGSAQADVDGVVGSLYAGYRYDLGGNSTLGFEGAVLYDATDCDTNCFLPGVRENTSDWEGRIAARYDATWGNIKPYAVVSVTHNFDDGQRVNLGNAIAEVDAASALLGLNLGIQADLGEGWSLTAEAATTQGLDSDVEGYQGMLGLRKTW